MLTYLSLHLNKWKKRPFLSLLLFCFPLLATLLLYPVFENTAEETAVPIAIVDEDNSDYSETILERTRGAERLRFTEMEAGEAEDAVRKGTMEAAFILEDGLQEALNDGDVRDVVTWVRSDEALFDVYAKEAIGAEVMRLALNAKAANAIDEDFDEAFAYSDSFWEPAPLFQMDFTERSPDNPDVEVPKLAAWHVMAIQLFFLYGWVLGIFFLRELIADEKEGRLQRIRLIQQTTVRYFASHFVLFCLVGAGSFLLGLGALFYLADITQVLVQAWLVRSLIVFAITLLVTWCLFMGTGRKRWMVPVLVLLALASFLLTVTSTGITGIWPHSWLVGRGGLG
ncbi:ABC transporter permease [Halobacillus salinus]|uniref:ABC transporter permease n=1 Tax=Halobacillus salinus TaxID=192814 RepID=A0A4Z0GX42_9BACI|nr:ABC transporter permease [Halobacillus salinus]TGB01123.1 ABC transporter permease [Halobacillus salinus]